MNGGALISSLKGIGPKRASVLNDAGIMTIGDLYDYFPRRYLDRRIIKSIQGLREGETATIVGRVLRTRLEGKTRAASRFKAWLGDDTGILELTWFRGVRYFSRSILADDVLAVYGKVSFFGHQRQMQHPEYDKLNLTMRDRQDGAESDIDLLRTGTIIPLYPSTEAMREANLTSKQLRVIIARAFEEYPPGEAENLSPDIIAVHDLLPLGKAYREIHFPSTPEQLERARYRMKWTELFFAQLLFALRHNEISRHSTAACFTHSGEVTRKLYESLPFDLTGAQKNAVREIYRDLRSGRPMNRLLQGDVGSGKTLVAMFSMALAADNGFQSAFMAPTEILAVQHFLVMKRLFSPLGLRIVLLTGKQGRKERQAILSSIESGETHIVTGTHALIEEGVKYRSLGLVVIDEQHRFGVLQRKALREKAVNPHLLLMTATPIPRTLAMGMFGDLDVSSIRELPAGRKPVRTVILHEQDRLKVYGFLRSFIEEGRQGYIVYPLVEESEKMDLKAAVESFGELSSQVFPDLRLGLIHGQMTPDVKEEVMDRFRNGELHILVGTTVIEVGVDVPNATVMVIEHAERFGLSQLHQLRGRVGRGEHASACVLVYSKQSQDARERLDAMETTSDGFEISEIDARIRGVGNILGKEQSGTLSGLRIADITTDFAIMQSARKSAFSLVERDERLEADGNRMIRAHYLRCCQGRLTFADIG